jgi:RNA polymerase sigma-70 factor, ECF subfamily
LSRFSGLMDTAGPMVTPLTFIGGEDALIAALRVGHPGAAAVFYDQHAAHVQRTLQSVLGIDADIPDLLQDVFIRAIDRIGELEELDRVRSWLTTIAVFTARAHIRRRARRKWLFLFSPEQTRSRQQEPPSSEARVALRETYHLLDRLPVNERMAFVLRVVHGMTLTDAAEACGTSLATFKRRLSRAEKKFLAAARERPELQHWMEEGTRWSLQKRS